MGKQNFKRKVTNRSNKWKQWFVGNEQEKQGIEMATYYFKGTAKWAKLDTPVPTYDKKGTEWMIDLYMDDESWELFNESDCQLKIKESKDDSEPTGRFVTLRCPTQKLIKDKIVSFEAPAVLDASNNPYPSGTKIGNGSTVTCKVDIYNTFKGKGHQLAAVRVEELVEYEGSIVKGPDDVVPF